MLKNIDIVKGIASEYDALFYFDLNTDKFEECILADRLAPFRDFLSGYTNFGDALQAFISKWVHSDFKAAMRCFGSPEKIRRQLSGCKKRVVRFLYNSGENGYIWVDMVIIKCEAAGVPADMVLVGFINVDDEVSNEMHRQAVFKTLTDEYEMIDYISIGENKLEDSITNYWRSAYTPLDGKWTKCRTIHDMLEGFREGVVWPLDRDRFYRETRRETVLASFAKGLPHVVNFQAVVNGKPLHYQLRFVQVPTRSSRLEIVAACRSIEAEVRKELHHEALIKALIDEYEVVALVGINPNKLEDTIKIYQSKAKTLLQGEWMKVNNAHDMLEAFRDELVWGADMQRFFKETRREAIFASFDKGLSHVVSFRASVKGQAVHYQVRFVALSVEESRTEFIMAFRNVEEEKRQEIANQNMIEEALAWAEEANEAKSTFLFNMSHDIRTPMNAIIGFNELALKHIDDRERLVDALTKVGAASQQLLRLITDVLEMARIESGKVSVDAVRTDIVDGMDNVISMMTALADEKHIEFVHDYKNVSDRVVYADGMRVEQILLNIISNAIKYTNSNGRVSVTMEEMPSEHDGMAHLRFVISDNGIGMSSVFLAHIFDMFSRERNSTISRVQGNGLGMAMVKQLLDMMHGRIHITSELGKGTTVVIELDFKVAEERPAAPAVAAGDVSIKGMKVLVVDDNELNREIAKEVLIEFGVEVEEADDGSTAIERLSQPDAEKFDAVLMDVQMPIVGGYKATHEIRSFKNPKVAAIPIIAMTANAFNEDREKAFGAGMNDHISKPINVDVVLKTLVKYRR